MTEKFKRKLSILRLQQQKYKFECKRNWMIYPNWVTQSKFAKISNENNAKYVETGRAFTMSNAVNVENNCFNENEINVVYSKSSTYFYFVCFTNALWIQFRSKMKSNCPKHKKYFIQNEVNKEHALKTIGNRTKRKKRCQTKFKKTKNEFRFGCFSVVVIFFFLFVCLKNVVGNNV